MTEAHRSKRDRSRTLVIQSRPASATHDGSAPIEAAPDRSPGASLLREEEAMRTLRATASLLGVLGLLACSAVRERIQLLPNAGGSAYTASQLRDALAGWASGYQAEVAAACDRIRGATRDRDARRSCLLWQLRMVPLSKEAAFRSDPQEAYVASLALASAQRAYLSEGEGATLFGAQQPLAQEASRQIEDQAFAIGRSFLSDKQLVRLDKEVDGLVASHPIGGAFAADSLITSFTGATARRTFSWVVNLPMVPFRALSGVSDTAQAVQQFDETAREFTETVGQLPPLTRWQLELLLYDAEELESVDRALRAAESFADGAERISTVAETLPGALGEELTARLEQSRAAIAELDRALARAEALAGPLEHVSDRLGDASAEWTAILARPEAAADEGGRPFDVREYESAAGRIADASRDLRALVADVNALDTGPLEALVDRAAWRAAILVCVFFAALAAYRLVTARVRARPAS
jgi:hypothetical protein